MKALCPRDGLLMAFQLAGSAVPTREVKPILQNLKAVAEDGRCSFLATDLELGIRLDVLGLQIQEPGEAILPAQQFLKILRETPDEELSLETTSTTCTVQGKHSFFEMPSEDPAHFPQFPTFDESSHHEISAGTLREMIRRTIFAVGGANSRHTMTGLCWELDGEDVTIVGTDSRRLAMIKGKGTVQGDHGTKGRRLIVPAKTMHLLDRNLQDDDEMVRVCFQTNEVLFRTELASINSRLVEGTFPDYRQAFPPKSDVVIPFRTGDLLDGVRQAAVMTEEESKRVTFHFENGTLTMRAQGARSGRSQVEMPANYDGDELDIHFNPAYVIDLLKILPAEEEVRLEMTDGAHAAMFKVGTNYSYLVMPLT